MTKKKSEERNFRTEKNPGRPKSTVESALSAQTKEASVKQEKERTFPIVSMGASAGGLEAIEKFFINMPHDSGIAFIIIMHFDLSAKSVMADILKGYTKMEVFQVEDGMKVEPVYHSA